MHFENRFTHDFLEYVHAHKSAPNADLIFTMHCHAVLRDTLFMAMYAARKLGAKTVRMPGLGLGEFSKALTVCQDRLLKAVIIHLVGEVAKMPEFEGRRLDYRYP